MYKILQIKYTPIKTFSGWNFLFMFHFFSHVLKREKKKKKKENMKLQLRLISHLISVSQMLSFFFFLASGRFDWKKSSHCVIDCSRFLRNTCEFIELLFCDQAGVRSMVYLALEAALSHLLLSHRLNQSNSWKHRRVAFRMRNIGSKIALSRCTVARYSVHLRNFHFVPIFMQSFSVFNELREFTRALSQLPH